MSKLDLTKQSSSNNDEEAFLKELEEETNIITETEKENRRLQSEYSEVLRENVNISLFFFFPSLNKKHNLEITGSRKLFFESSNSIFRRTSQQNEKTFNFSKG